jgi:arylsulfatase A-like enzyme
VWADYLRQIEIVDSLAVLTWNHLQADPDYANQTYLLITADHGRHDDAHGGFQNHGDDCPSCRHIIFLALGPGIRAGYETSSLYTQRDVCATVGSILGIATPLAEGSRMDEIFQPASTGIVH